MTRGRSVLIPGVAAAFLGVSPVLAQTNDAVPRPLRAAALNSIVLPSGGTLYQTGNAIVNQRLVAVPGSQAGIATWSEVKPPYEVPNIPTLPLHHGCSASHAIAATPSSCSCPQYSSSAVPSESPVPRTSMRATTKPRSAR